MFYCYLSLPECNVELIFFWCNRVQGKVHFLAGLERLRYGYGRNGETDRLDGAILEEAEVISESQNLDP